MTKRIILVSALCAAIAAAQAPEELSDWPYYKETTVPGGGWGIVDLDAEALGSMQDNGGDLRIFDAAGVEIPYALRLMVGSRAERVLEAEEFNRSSSDSATQFTLDLGADPGEHNAIEIRTAGETFRRRVRIEGSDDADEWASMPSRGMLIRAETNGANVEMNRIPYPSSRFRYLRISVEADAEFDDAAPAIESAAVHQVVLRRGEEQATPVRFLEREDAEADGSPASTYRIEFAGRIPVKALRMRTPDAVFSRGYRIDALEGERISPRRLASGVLTRTEDAPSRDVTLRFQEAFAKELRLTIVDDRNPPLELSRPVVFSSVRRLIIDLDSVTEGPIRIYYGNGDAPAPNYDFGASLPAELGEDIVPLFVGLQTNNPTYQAPEPPLTERAPWLIYVVLAAASLGLLAILRSLVLDVDGEGGRAA